MTIEAEGDVAVLNRIGKIVSSVLKAMLDAAEPGGSVGDVKAGIGTLRRSARGGTLGCRVVWPSPGCPVVTSHQS